MIYSLNEFKMSLKQKESRRHINKQKPWKGISEKVKNSGSEYISFKSKAAKETITCPR